MKKRLTATAFTLAGCLFTISSHSETITLLESFEDNVDNVFHLQDTDANRRILEFSQSDDNTYEQLTDGSNALKVSFSGMSGWQRDFQVVLDSDATTALQNVIDTEETGRYYLMYEITWDSLEGSGWANQPLEIGGWLHGDQIEWGGGNTAVTMAYELGAGTPEGFSMNLAGDDGDQAFLNFIFNSNISVPMDVYVDNIRLVDTQPAPGTRSEVTLLDSFENSTASIIELGRAEAPTTNEEMAFVTEGSKSAKIILTGDGSYGSDATIDTFSDRFAAILDLPPEERAQYTLAWDWFVELGETTSSGWGIQQLIAGGNGSNLTQSWADDLGMRTRAINLSLVDWETPPVLTIIHNSNWSGGNVHIYIDNLRVIDTGFVPNIFSISGSTFDDSGFSFNWNTTGGKSYEIHRSASPSNAWEKVADVTANSGTSSYTDSNPAAGTGFYQVLHVPPPPLFEDDFESGAQGWTTSTLNAGSSTKWELGTPTNARGPASAHSGENVYGTDLDADYELLTQVVLRSPVIDLTGVDKATLVYWGFQDLEAVFIEIKILDNNGNEFLADPIRKRAGTTPGWQESRIKIPEAALGRKIILEFGFTSDDFNEFDPDTGIDITQAGWFIDDVAILPE